MKLRIIFYTLTLFIVIISIYIYYDYSMKELRHNKKIESSSSPIPSKTKDAMIFKNKESEKINQLVIPVMEINHDEDQDGIKDLADILEGARKDAENRPSYRSAYYNGGFPPDDEGVCTDVIWRAFKHAGYNLKSMVDKDIKENLKAYPRVGGKPDPNIDFRRVPNLVSFFDRHAITLTKELIPNDIENLKEWQPGDIVVFGKPLDHIGIVSDIRREDGVPYMIHNGSPYTKEEDAILYWHEKVSNIIGHYRWPNKQ